MVLPTLNTSEDAEHFAYEDNYWRMVCLQPLGQAWHARLVAVTRDVVLNGKDAGEQLIYQCHYMSKRLSQIMLHIKDLAARAGLWNIAQ